MSLPGRALADLLGGSEGGWAFWSAALAAIEVSIARSRERRDAFCAYPKGELDRFLRDVDDALGLAVTAVAVQQLVTDGETDGRERERRAAIAELLLDRARAAAHDGNA